MSLYNIVSPFLGVLPHQDQFPATGNAVDDVTDNREIDLAPETRDQAESAPVQTTATASKPIDLSSQFELTLAKAKAGEPTSAPLRLALYLCLQQNRGAFVDAADMATKATPLAGGLIDLLNSNTTPLDRAEMALLFDEFLKAFDEMVTKRNQSTWSAPCTLETLSFRWSVDYGPCGELAKIMRAGHKKVKEAREAVNGPPVPHTAGVGFKCMYRVDESCAYFGGHVIDHEGKLLEEHPWETFYKTGQESDEKLAKELSPHIPQNISIKFENRNIIRSRGYTGTKNAEQLYATGNLGLVRHLIQEDKDTISYDVRYKVLKLAASLQDGETCKDLFKAGLSMYDTRDKSYSPLCTVIEHCDASTLTDILELAQYPDHWNFDALKEVIRSLCVRYGKIAAETLPNAKFDTDELNLVAKMWTCAQHPQCKAYSDIPYENRSKCLTEFYKTVVSSLATMQITPNENYSTFEKHLREGIEELEKENGPVSSETVLFQPPLDEKPGLVDLEAAKLEDQEIVSTMGYTFDANAKKLAYADNWGLVRCLLKGNISENAASKVLEVAIYNKKWDVCEILFGAGLSVETSNGNGRYSAFMDTIRHCDSDHLLRILTAAFPSWVKTVRSNREDLNYFKQIANRFYSRFKDYDSPATDKQKEMEVLAMLTKMWIQAHHPEDDVTEVTSEGYELFYQEINSNIRNNEKLKAAFYDITKQMHEEQAAKAVVMMKQEDQVEKPLDEPGASTKLETNDSTIPRTGTKRLREKYESIDTQGRLTKKQRK